MTAAALLKNIYTAKQCSDMSDCNYAISEVLRIAHTYGWSPALRSRLASLSKKLSSITQ